MAETDPTKMDLRTVESMRSLIRQSIEARRQAVVYGLARKMYQRFSEKALQHGGSQEDWESIASLSQLRGLVGGRFQNLKEKWLNAGLPLRAHRGDREEKADMNHDGWLELAAWIHKQGYEARLCDREEEGLFQVRKL